MSTTGRSAVDAETGAGTDAFAISRGSGRATTAVAFEVATVPVSFITFATGTFVFAGAPGSRTRRVRFTTSSVDEGRPLTDCSHSLHRAGSAIRCAEPTPLALGREPSCDFTQRSSVMLICEPNPAPRRNAYS